MAPREFPQQRFTAPDHASQILLVRHGESQTYREDAPLPINADGQGDPPLTDIGQHGAEQVGERLGTSGERIAGLYVTNLVRTHQTAAPLAARIGLDPVEVPELREIHLGDWEGGLSRKMFADGHPISQQVIAERRYDPIPNAETSEHFGERIRRGIEFIASRHVGELAVAVVHGGVIGEVLHQATGAERFTFSVDNASITHLVVEPERWYIRTFNDVSHRWPTFGH